MLYSYDVHMYIQVIVAYYSYIIYIERELALAATCTRISYLIQYKVPCTLYLYIVQVHVYNVHRTRYYVHPMERHACIIMYYVLHIVQGTLYIVHMYKVRGTRYEVRCTRYYYVLCTRVPYSYIVPSSTTCVYIVLDYRLQVCMYTRVELPFDPYEPASLYEMDEDRRQCVMHLCIWSPLSHDRDGQEHADGAAATARDGQASHRFQEVAPRTASTETDRLCKGNRAAGAGSMAAMAAADGYAGSAGHETS